MKLRRKETDVTEDVKGAKGMTGSGLQSMETKQWHTVDKSTWERGPWDNEPDKMQWQDGATGLPCLILRSKFSGSLCGYVGVGADHPAFGKEMDEVNVSVHGGLVWTSRSLPGEDKSVGICHVHPDGRKLWWLGFNCNEFGDLQPRPEATEHSRLIERSFVSSYKDLEYMKAEVTELAHQLKQQQG